MTVPPTRRALWARRIRRALLVGVALAAVLLVVAYRYITDSARVRTHVEAYLSQFFNGRVTVGSAEWGLFGGVRLQDVRLIRVSGAAEETVFECPSVELRHAVSSLLLGQWVVTSVTADRPHLTIAREAITCRSNLAGLICASATYDPEVGRVWPVVELREAGVEVISRSAQGDRTVDELDLTIRAVPDSPLDPIYQVTWRSEGTPSENGHARFDLRHASVRNVYGGLPRMSIDAVMIALDAQFDGAGSWSNLLGLGGTVRATDYDLHPEGAEGGERFISVDLHDARLAIPVDEYEHSLPPGERYLRFEQVNGAVRLTGNGVEAQFAGRFHGAECHVKAQMHAGTSDVRSLDDVAFEAQLEVTDLAVPALNYGTPEEVRRFLTHWRRLKIFYRDFDPSGVVDLQVQIAKGAGVEAPVELRYARLTSKGGTMTVNFFPYTATDVQGVVEYTPEGFFIRELVGHHGAGTIRASGWVEDCTIESAAQLHFFGDNIAVDQALYAALRPRFRDMWDLFDPRGTVSIDLQLERGEGRDGVPAPWRSEVTVGLEGVSARYAGFPYPLEHVGGVLMMSDTEFYAHEVRGRQGAADVRIHGGVQFAEGDVAEVELGVDGRNVSLDATLLAALPESFRGPVEAFHAEGRFDADAVVCYDVEAKQVSPVATVVLRDVAIRPDALPLPIRDVRGVLDLSPQQIVVQRAEGRYNEAVLTARGAASLGGAEEEAAAPVASFDVHVRGLQLDDAVRGAAPAEIREALWDWQIEGPLDLAARIARTDSGALTSEGTVMLDRATVRHRRAPQPLTDVSGRIAFGSQGVSMDGLQARYGDAQLSLTYQAPRHGVTGTRSLRLDARGLELDESLRAVLPGDLARAWERMRPSGAVDAVLTWTDLPPDAAGGDKEAGELDAKLTFYDTALRGLGDLRHIAGTLTAAGRVCSGKVGTYLTGELAIASAEVVGRRLEDLTAQWTYGRTRDGHTGLTVDPIQGYLYGGDVVGNVELLCNGERTEYTVEMTGRDIDLRDLVNARVQQAGADVEYDVAGRAAVRVYLAGDLDDPQTRRGGGRMEITRAELFRLPIMLAILHVLNLSLPGDDVFTDCEADFLIAGDTLKLEPFSLESGALVLYGKGSVSLKDQYLNMHLVSENQSRWARIPGISDVLQQAARELVELHVTGPLSRPTVRAESLPGLGEELRNLFRKKQPRVIEGEARR